MVDGEVRIREANLNFRVTSHIFTVSFDSELILLA